MKVKICGTTNLKDARLSVEFGADALGFIFAPSKRQVDVARTKAITRELPLEVERVGVFVEPEIKAIAAAVREAGLSAVQMHWSYNKEIVSALRWELGGSVRLWQVVGYEVNAEDTEEANREFSGRLRAGFTDPGVDAVLLDALRAGQSGGLGQTFPWAQAAHLLTQERAAAERKTAGAVQPLPQVLLAGGLTPENVSRALEVMQVDGVDVVTGVEAGPGIKAPDRLRAFLIAAKG